MIIWLVLLGLSLGSFVNALVWRLHERAKLEDTIAHRKKGSGVPTSKERQRLADLSMWHGRSMCPHCQHPLAARDLIPVFSWLFLRGKCRYCQRPIDDTPLPELVTPLIFVASFLWWPMPFHGIGLLTFIFWLIFVVGFVALALYDFRWMLLPDKMVYPLIGLAVIELILQLLHFHAGLHVLVDAGAGVLVVSGLFFVLYVASGGEWIGGGDVKLGILLGILAGDALRGALLLFIASLAGVLFAVPQMTRGQAGRKAHIPFGPFLIFGLLVVQLFGSGVIDWYARLLAG